MFKLISRFKRKKNIFCFHAYNQILKVFQPCFHKKQKITIFSCFKNAKKERIL